MKQTYVETSVHGAIAGGANVKEAKARAIARIEAAFLSDHDYHPQLVRFPKGEIGLVYRTLAGWQYDCLWPDDDKKTCYGCGHYARKVEADKALRRHVAQGYWNDPDTSQGLTLLGAVTAAEQAEHQRYVRFQEAYKRYHDMGKSAVESHWLAGQECAA